MGALLRGLAVDPAKPQPLVVEGAPAEWEAAERDPHAATAAMSVRSCVAATVGIVRGPVRGPCTMLPAFDLRAGESATPPDLLTAHGDAAQLEAWIASWRAAFERTPQACTTAAVLLRSPRGLHHEALAYSALQSGPEFQRWLEDTQGSRTAADDPPTANEWDLPVAYTGRRVTVLASTDYREIVLTRPDRHNALDTAMRAELCDVLDALITEPVTVGLRGTGPSFCSGGDLAEFGALRDPMEALFARQRWSVAERVRQLADRMTVALHGSCIGAGIELAAFAARVIAAPSTRIRLPEAGFGLIPGSGGMVSVPARIGAHRALDLIVTGRWVDAREAQRIGLVDEIVDDAELVAALRARTARG